MPYGQREVRCLEPGLSMQGGHAVLFRDPEVTRKRIRGNHRIELQKRAACQTGGMAGLNLHLSVDVKKVSQFFMGILLCMLGIIKSSPLELTAGNVDAVLKNEKGLPVFVLVWDPWCPHCKVFKPEWEKLGGVAELQAKVMFAMLNCESEKEVCKRISPGHAFPRLVWVDAGTGVILRYSGNHNMNDVLSFIKKQFAGPVSVLQAVKDLEEFVAQSRKQPCLLFNISASDNHSIEVVENVTSQLRHLDVKFGLIPDSLHHYPRLVAMENGKVLEEFHGTFDRESLTQFIKRHLWRCFTPYTDVVKMTSEFEGVPLGIFVLNLSDKESKIRAAKEALALSDIILTAHTFCEYNSEFCRYVGAKAGSIVIFNHSINTFWIYDKTTDLSSWTRKVLNGETPGHGPGTGYFKDFWIFFYETKSHGGIRYYALYLPLVLVIIFSALSLSMCFSRPRKQPRKRE